MIDYATVSISYHLSVTRIVCSHCAESDPSFVLAVQLSLSSFEAYFPLFIIGSIVNTIPDCIFGPVFFAAL